MINIFTSEITPRLRYISHLICTQLLNNEVQLVTNIEEFNAAHGTKINYSENSSITGFQIKPAPILFENHIKEFTPEVSRWKELPILFENDHALFPFDIFAASFYLVTRYEEYFSGKKDKYGRFRAKSSIALKNNFIDQPLINLWSIELAKLLVVNNPAFQWKKPDFKYLPTIDIDNAYAFKYKGLIRNVGSAFKDLKKLKFHAVTVRFLCFFGLKKDPYDSYDFIEKLFSDYHFSPKYFVLLCKSGHYDKSLAPSNYFYKKLIRRLTKSGEVGIHPSYSSNKIKEQAAHETHKLSKILTKKVTSNRQHYLKFSIPKTYRQLIENGITDEYSMGYATTPGFRSSISIPYTFYDLILNTNTELVVHPFQVMDGTFRNYLKVNPDEALAQIKVLIDRTKQVGGTFVSLWHNESLSDRGYWKDWQAMYIEMTKYAFEKTNEQ